MEKKYTNQHPTNTLTKQMEARGGSQSQLPLAPFHCRRQPGATGWIWLAAAILLLFGYCKQGFAQSHYELWFTMDRVQHHALLRQTEGRWQMRVRYNHRQNGGQLIEETLRPQQIGAALCLRGCKVWDVRRGQTPTDYSRDNLHLFYDAKGHVNGTNVDAQGTVAALVLKRVDAAALPERLLYFEWN